jgi:hypothetical protein
MTSDFTPSDFRFLARLVGKQIHKVERDRRRPQQAKKLAVILAEGRGDQEAMHLARMRELLDKLQRLERGSAVA